MENESYNVIAAVSTPLGTGGIGIVRLSGEGAVTLADKIFKAKDKKPLESAEGGTMHYGGIYEAEGGFIDEVLVCVMRAPRTYTREDTVEINCHGGIIAVNRVLEEALKSGARLAEPGEFTKKAFLNGRIDLSQAEAVIDVINSKTALSQKAAASGLNGVLRDKIRLMREEILLMTASIEASIDYPEHEIEADTFSEMYDKCERLAKETERLIKTSEAGKILREGIETVILGRTNVGKSSLLNLLLDEERAIVTDIPGTTRDTLEEYVNIAGVPVKIADTAGIRDTDDAVEKIGVERARKYAERAELILMVLDGAERLTQEDREILSMIKGKKTIVLINKSDLPQLLDEKELLPYFKKEDIIRISTVKKEGSEKISGRIKEMFSLGEITGNGELLVSNLRHRNALFRAKESLVKACETISIKMPEDFISIHLKEALYALGEITGDTADDEIINKIFSEFCLGK